MNRRQFMAGALAAASVAMVGAGGGAAREALPPAGDSTGQTHGPAWAPALGQWRQAAFFSPAMADCEPGSSYHELLAGRFPGGA